MGVSRDENNRGGGVVGLLVAAIVAPLAATLVQLAISRSREYVADATGARLAGSPYGLADALEKLAYAAERIPADATPATAHLFAAAAQQWYGHDGPILTMPVTKGLQMVRIRSSSQAFHGVY